MPSILPGGKLVARAQQINGAAQLVIGGTALYWGMRALNLLPATITTINVTDATAAGGPLIDLLSLAGAAGGGTTGVQAPVRTESGIFVDAGAAVNATIVVYYTPLEWIATLGADLPHDFFVDVAP